MGEHVNQPPAIALGVVGVALLIAMAAKTAFVDLPPKVRGYLNPPVAEQVEPANPGVE